MINATFFKKLLHVGVVITKVALNFIMKRMTRYDS